MAPDPNSPLPTHKKRKLTAKHASYGIGTLLSVVAALLYVYGYPEAAVILGSLGGAGLVGPNVRRRVRKAAVVVAILSCFGCVQATFVVESPRSSPRAHQDIARTTSSTQSADGSLEVPVSLVPK